MASPRPAAGTYLAHQQDTRRRRRRVLVRDVLVILVSATVVAVAGQYREIANPARPEAAALTERLDAVYRDVRSGELSLVGDATSIDDVRAARVAEDRWAVTGEVNETCYAMWWAADGTRHVRTVPDLLACEPSIGSSFEPETVARAGLSADEGLATARWDGLLPPGSVVALWWLPLLLVAGGLMLGAVVRIIVVLATGRIRVRGMT